jgi:hypothetical protein
MKSLLDEQGQYSRRLCEAPWLLAEKSSLPGILGSREIAEELPD